jgi:hypothetical protein
LFSLNARRANQSRPALVEKLESRQLLAGDVTAVALPYALEFNKPHGGVVDRDGQGTGFAYVMPNDTKSEYRKGALDIRTGASYLRIKSRGDNYGTDNSLVNGLMTTFVAANAWHTTAVMRGPFSLQNGQGVGIMFGPDANNFVRVALVNRNGNVGIEWIDEQKIKSGFRRQLPGTVTNIGTISTITNLELTISGNSTTGRLNAYYRVNGGSYLQLPATIRLRTDKRKYFFSTQSHAGVMAFNSPSAGSVSAVVDSFAVRSGLPGVSSGPGGNTTPLNVNTATRYFNDVRGGGTSETKSISITNPNKSAVTISSISIVGADSSQFVLSGANTGSHSIAAGATETFNVAMSSGSNAALGLKTANISISAASGSATVPLRGLATAGQGGTNEPSLQRVFDLYQIPVNTGDPTPDTYDLPATATSADEVDLQRLSKAGSGNVTIEPLAIFGVGSNSAQTVNFGWYTSGSKNSKHQVLSIGGTGQSTQTVNPSINGSTSFDPGNGQFSLYMQFPSMYPTVVQTPGGTEAYGEDQYNTYDPNTHRKIRAYRLRNSDGTIVPNAYIVAGEDLNASYDTQDFVAILRNVKPAVAAPQISFVNPQTIPFDNRIVFNRITNLDPTNPNQVHDTATVQVVNTGTQPLAISGYDLSSGWQVLSGPSSTTIAPGATQNYSLKFTYDGGTATNQLLLGHIRFNTNDPSQPQANVELAGFWQNQSEHNTEPSFAQILQLAGYTTNATFNGQNINGGGKVQALGDEVLSNYWTRADSSTAVTVRQLSQWHTQGNTAAFNWVDKATNGQTNLFVAEGLQGQSFLPEKSGSSSLATGTFSPTGDFYIKIDNESSVDSQNVQEQGGGGWGHHLRFYPAKDRQGAVIPNTYILTMDYQGINYDYNDNVYIISNIKPA